MYNLEGRKERRRSLLISQAVTWLVRCVVSYVTRQLAGLIYVNCSLVNVAAKSIKRLMK
jgi:hypothetical protein